MRLQIFTIKKFIRQTDFVLKKDESFYPQVFLKECKYIEKKVIRLMNFENVFFEGVIF